MKLSLRRFINLFALVGFLLAITLFLRKQQENENLSELKNVDRFIQEGTERNLSVESVVEVPERNVALEVNKNDQKLSELFPSEKSES